MYRCGADGAATFIKATASTGEKLHALLQTVIARFMKMLTRWGVLVDEIGQTWLAEPDSDGEEDGSATRFGRSGRSPCEACTSEISLTLPRPLKCGFAAIAVESRWKPNSLSGLNCGHCVTLT